MSGGKILYCVKLLNLEYKKLVGLLLVHLSCKLYDFWQQFYTSVEMVTAMMAATMVNMLMMISNSMDPTSMEMVVMMMAAQLW